MRRSGRRQINDYLEENEELNFAQTEELYEDEYEEYDEDREDILYEEEKSGAAFVWKKIGKIALIILALIALFFVSMKVTEICLDRNQEPDSYGTDAPAYSDSDYEEESSDVPVIEEEPEENVGGLEVLDEADVPQKPKTEEPEKTEKTEEAVKPSAPSEPSTPQTPATPEPEPSTPQTPSTPSKPIITPGNPAA